MRKKKRRKRLNWFPPAEATLKCTLIQKLISVLLKNRPPEVSSAACSGEDGPIFLLTTECPAIKLRSELCRTESLTQSTSATIPGWRRRVFFLVWLKDRKIFGLCFLCLSCDVQDLGGILGSWRVENLEFLQNSRVCRCERTVLPGCLISKAKSRGNLIRTKFKERITSEISPTQFPRKPLTARSVSLHKGTNECAPRIPKRSTSLHKGINDGAPHIPKRQERALGRRRGSNTHGGQDSTGRDIGPRTSKSSSPLEEPDSRILRGYYGAENFGNPGPFQIKPKAHAEEGEMSEDERRRSKLPGDVAEDNPILNKPRSRKEKAAHHQGQSHIAS